MAINGSLKLQDEYITVFTLIIVIKVTVLSQGVVIADTQCFKKICKDPGQSFGLYSIFHLYLENHMF